MQCPQRKFQLHDGPFLCQGQAPASQEQPLTPAHCSAMFLWYLDWKYSCKGGLMQMTNAM